MLPTFWLRNTWAWWPDQPKPALRDVNGTIASSLGLNLHFDTRPPLLFTENETNNRRLFGTANASPYVKDGINDFVVSGRQDAINPNNAGTKSRRTLPCHH